MTSYNFGKKKPTSKTKNDSKPSSRMTFEIEEEKIEFDMSRIENIDPIEEYARFQLYNSTQNLFITGKAGTGKSTLLKEFVDYCRFKKLNVAVVAPTGIASINVGGATIHSFFQLNIDNPTELKKLIPIRKKLLEAVNILIVDEISMVSDLHFDQMDRRLNQAKFGLNPHNRQFGGVRVVLFGDLFQLGPVSKEGSEVGYFFESKTFGQMHAMNNIKMLELNKIWRQDDKQFIDFLGKVRHGYASEEDLELINSKLTNQQPIDIVKQHNISILCTLNHQVNRYNSQILSTLDTPIHIFKGKVNDDFGHFDSLPPLDLELKVGCLVVFVKNDMDKRWVNGDFGSVIRFGYKLTLDRENVESYRYYWDYQNRKDEIRNDMTELPERGFRIKEAGYVIEITITRTNQVVQVEKDIWEKKQYVPIEEAREEDGEMVFETKIKDRIIGSYQQFPLKLGYAITTHKSQGMTLSGAIIDFSGGSFGSGLLYVALSRVKSLDNLYLTKAIEPKDILLDPKVIGAYQAMQQNSGGIIE